MNDPQIQDEIQDGIRDEVPDRDHGESPGVSRVLLVDEKPDRAALLRGVLRDAGVAHVMHFSGLDGLLDRVLQMKPDLVLVEVDSPKRDTLEQLTTVTRRLPVVLACNDRSAASIESAIQSGVCSYIEANLRPEAIAPLVALAKSTFQRFAVLEDELERAVSQIDHRRLIDDVKGTLIREHRYTEPQAHRLLQKMAMDTNRPIVEVARELKRYAGVFRPPA